MRLYLLCSLFISAYFTISCMALSRANRGLHNFAGYKYPRLPNSVSPLGNPHMHEPTCEELRAMWWFSKRQSRATELTNEIPMYRDPFAYNMRVPYTHQMAAENDVLNTRGRGYIYGRVLHYPPYPNAREGKEKHSPFEEVVRLLAATPQSSEPANRNNPALHFPRGSTAAKYLPTKYKSFEQLKNIIRLERAQELQQQRIAQENAVRSEALKNGFQYIFPQNSALPNGVYDTSPDMDKHMVAVGYGMATYPEYMPPSPLNYDEDEFSDNTQVDDRLYNDGQSYIVGV